jgi:hypothetical protein
MSAKWLVFFVILGLTIIMRREGWSTDWRPYQATRSGDIYYFDPESIEKLPGGVARVWVKMEKTEVGGDDLGTHVNEVISGRKDMVKGEIIQLLEINCSSKKFRVINLAVYDSNNDIKEYYSDPSEWQPIPLKSVTNDLHQKVCK